MSLPWQGSCRNGSQKLRVHFFHQPQQAARTHWKLHDALKSQTYLNNRLPPVRQQLLNLSRQYQDQVFKHLSLRGTFVTQTITLEESILLKKKIHFEGSWRDNSAAKCLLLKYKDLHLDPQHSQKALWVQWHITVIPSLQRWRPEIAEVHWPANLATSVILSLLLNPLSKMR